MYFIFMILHFSSANLISDFIVHEEMTISVRPFQQKTNSSLCNCRTICETLASCTAFTIQNSSESNVCSIYTEDWHALCLKTDATSSTWYKLEKGRRSDGRIYFVLPTEMEFTAASNYCKQFTGFALPIAKTADQLDVMSELYSEYDHSLWLNLKSDPKSDPVWGDGTKYESFVVSSVVNLASLIKEMYYMYDEDEIVSATEESYPVCSST